MDFKSEIMAIKSRLLAIEKKQSDFSAMLSKSNRADIDFIAMETDIDLEQGKEDDVYEA